ncbi:hypothetical protein ACP70R_034877 [Stipagrostis hirtigluma subsp. patula]
MAELAAGAVSSLLCVIRNEALLLGGVQSDVQFIKEEMESMNSFLVHLARSAPPGGEHDEQMRTWMNQVRFLAQDCNNCIDLYLYRGNPDVQRARGRIRRYLWWVYWFLHKLVAQHQAAIQLRELKERARDVGERRLRYGVEVPAKPAVEQSPRVAGRTAAAPAPAVASWAHAVKPNALFAYAAENDEEDGEDQLVVATSTANHSGRRAYLQPRTLVDYFQRKLVEWVNGLPAAENKDQTFSIAIMAPATYLLDAYKLAYEALVFHPDRDDYFSRGYHRTVLVDIPAVHLNLLPLRPKEVLYYILRQLKLEHSKSQTHEQGTDQSEGEEKGLDSYEVLHRQCVIHGEKRLAFQKIRVKIEEMNIYEKLDNIMKDTHIRLRKGFAPTKDDMDQLDLKVLFQLLFQTAAAQEDQLKNRDIHKLPEWDNNIIAKVANKFKEYMEADEKGKKLKEQKEEEEERGAGEEKQAAAGRGGREDGGASVAAPGREKATTTAAGGGRGECEERDDESGGTSSGGSHDDGRHQKAPIRLHEAQYEHILREVFSKTSIKSQVQQQDGPGAKQAKKTTLDEDQIKQIIQEAKQEILQELQEVKYDKNKETGDPSAPDQSTTAVFKKITEQKMQKIKQEFKNQLKIKGLVDEIKCHLKGDCPLFILKFDETIDTSRWNDIRTALNLLECYADALIVTSTRDTQQAKKYCYPPREPIDYSLAGLYHDTLLQLSPQMNADDCSPQIFRSILEECEPHEFCMKIFTHALYANPKKSNEELIMLLSTLRASPKSLEITAKKMCKFSYNDLPKEYKSCLLYLAIFQPEHKIKRSTLIGRWVAEGLIFKEDWFSSVRQADRCFDTLINRWLVYPADIGATGKVKSCVVSDIVHGFITKIARKQHIVEPRLSRHLARHFSIFNDLHLRSSEGIQNFFQRLSKSSRVSLLKVLDLEGCHCFGLKNQRYLKEICRKMLLLKYLSLRGTDITQLPSEINHLRELEVLDIRQTKVPENATRHVLLLKLKRLLAGHIDSSLSNSDKGTAIQANKLVSTVQIPHKIGKMLNLEVLFNVKAQNSHDLKEIGKLCYLRKLGVVIDDNNSRLRKLLQAISDLHECLLSLSITATKEGTHSSGLRECLRSLSTNARQEGTHSSEELPADIGSHLKHHPNLLESLCIRGKGNLLPLFAKPSNDKLAKVTLSSTSLNEDNMEVLDKLPNLRCVKLQDIACTESVLTFKENTFKYLKYLLVEKSDLTDITFKSGAANELEKMVLSSTKIESVSGVEGLQKLEELELHNNNNGRLLSSFDNAKQIAKLTLRGTLLEQGYLQILAKKPNLRCLVLLDKSCKVSRITFSKDEFRKLNHLIVHCSAITNIVFTGGACPKLEKIVWSFTSLSGINNLPRLKELEFNGNIVPNEVKNAIEEHKNRPTLKHNKLEIPDQAKQDEQEDDNNAARSSFCWKNQV